MKRIFKIEMKRAFLNRMFAASLLIGLAVCTIQIFAEVLPMQQYQQSLTQSDIYPHGVFSKWIGGGNSYWVVLYFALLPILAALPFADSLHADRRSGYVKIFLRAGREGRIIRQNLSLFFYPAARRQSCRCFGICTCPQCCCQVLCPTRLREPSGPKPRHCGLNNSIRSPISIRQSFVP